MYSNKRMDPKIIGAFALLCMCSISSSIATSMNFFSEEETSGPGPGGGGGGGKKTHGTPVSGKIFHINPAIGWMDPGPKSVDGHIAGNSIEDCYDKAPDGAVIAGWRSGEYEDEDYQNTCFYYTSSQQSGGPKQEAPAHTIACMDSTKDMNSGCGVPRTSDLTYGTTEAVGWLDPGAKPNGISSSSLEGCITQAPGNAKIVGLRDGSYPDTPYADTCFYYTETQTGLPVDSYPYHHLTCKDPSKSLDTGCA